MFLHLDFEISIDNQNISLQFFITNNKKLF